MHKKNRHFRTEEPRGDEKQLRRRGNTSRDYASLQRLGRGLWVGGLLLAVVLVVYGLYAVKHGLIPYLENQQAVSSAESQEESLPESLPVSTQPMLYDDKGLPVYDNAVSLRIINNTHPAEQTDVPVLGVFQGSFVDERILPALEALFAAAAEDDIRLNVTGGYVSFTEQDAAFNERVRKLEAEGTTSIMAVNHAERQVGRAGRCDLQTGMCVRIRGNAETFTANPVYEWLNNNALHYGFVFRYPEGTEDLTGHECDLLVLRYVGTENARQMRRLNMCLEEFAEYISHQG